MCVPAACGGCHVQTKLVLGVLNGERTKSARARVYQHALPLSGLCPVDQETGKNRGFERAAAKVPVKDCHRTLPALAILRLPRFSRDIAFSGLGDSSLA